ncbi:S-adenosylmethionine:tRNA ribosyltransferase-isomerase, partial [Gilvimarinus sp. 1_MG-2023]
TLDAYRHAVTAGYRFYSYGDAMFLSRPFVAAQNTSQAIAATHFPADSIAPQESE